MNTYLHNLLWSMSSGYVMFSIIFSTLIYSFWLVIVVKEVDDTYMSDIWDDIITPMGIGLLVSITVGFCWILILPLALIFGVSLFIVEFVIKVILPFYKFLKDLPIMDRRKGEDI